MISNMAAGTWVQPRARIFLAFQFVCHIRYLILIPQRREAVNLGFHKGICSLNLYEAETPMWEQTYHMAIIIKT